MSEITIRVHEGEIRCPRCGSTELDPATAGPGGGWIPGALFQIKAFRIQTADGRNWHKCLVCLERGEREHFFCHETGEMEA